MIFIILGIILILWMIIVAVGTIKEDPMPSVESHPYTWETCREHRYCLVSCARQVGEGPSTNPICKSCACGHHTGSETCYWIPKKS